MSLNNYEAMILPTFNQIKIDSIEKNVLDLLERANKTLTNIEENSIATWDSLIKPLEDLQIEIHNIWSPISHLHSVQNSPELRAVYAKLIEPMTSFYLKLEQSPKIYEKLSHIKKSSEFTKLSGTRQRILEKKILNAQLAGIALADEQKKTFIEIAKKLNQLSTQFSNNLLDAIKDSYLVITDRKDMGKLPASFLELTSEAYKNKFKNKESSKENGPWLITQEFTSYSPFMENSPTRELRKELYLASITLASSGKTNNTPLVNEILKLRKEQAKLLKFDSYAQLSLATKMAENVTQIYEMTNKLQKHARLRAEEELEELKSFTKKESGQSDFHHWDLLYWSKRLREEKFSYDEEELKPYFSFEIVTKGLFALAQNLFQITVKEDKSIAIEKWDQSVTFYNIYDKHNEHIASFYLDPYTRSSNKRSGAWMNNCIDRRKEKNGKITRPVAYLVCNFTPPTKTEPSLLTFREVETLFHEFGHGLQHMLTTIDDLDAPGISGIEWDSVELPSQFMENWCYHEPTLLNMAKHYKTGKTLPRDLFEKLQASKNYMVALGTLRQIYLTLCDLHLHDDYEPESEKLFELQNKVGREVLLMPPHQDDKILCRFSHIFAGGYSAGYYSYKWAEILSADAFSRFEEINLDDKEEVRKVGLKFKETILALGGSEDPMKIFEKFRGRKPTVDALLRHQGLI